MAALLPPCRDPAQCRSPITARWGSSRMTVHAATLACTASLTPAGTVHVRCTVGHHDGILIVNKRDDRATNVAVFIAQRAIRGETARPSVTARASVCRQVVAAAVGQRRAGQRRRRRRASSATPAIHRHLQAAAACLVWPLCHVSGQHTASSGRHACRLLPGLKPVHGSARCFPFRMRMNQ